MRISFAVISDTHFVTPGTRQDGEWWNRMLFSRSAEIAEALVTTLNSLFPDFVIHCGDFTDDGGSESFYSGKEAMDGLFCPYYIVPGNHDTGDKAGKEGIRQTIAPLFGLEPGRFRYVRDIGGVHFVFLDCAYWFLKDGGVSEYNDGNFLGIDPTEKELRWLEGELESSGDGLPVDYPIIDTDVWGWTQAHETNEYWTINNSWFIMGAIQVEKAMRKLR